MKNIREPPRRAFLSLTLDNVKGVNRYINKFAFDVDIKCGNKCVDGKSVIGLLQMCGHKVEVCPIVDDEEQINGFYDGLRAFMRNDYEEVNRS